MGLLDSLMGFSGKTRIGEVELDASISQVHALDADVTEHPVEEGSVISDHHRPRPRTIQIDGQVSDVSVETGYPGQSAVSSIASAIRGDDPVKAAWETLRGYFENGDLISISTSLEEYPDILITGISVTRDAAFGRILRFQLTARQVRIVQTLEGEALEIPDAAAGAAGKAAEGEKGSKGKKQSKNASNGKKQSVLANAADKGAGFFGG